MPKFSINIITYNRCILLNRALNSVYFQDYKDYEVLVFDNASTDKTQSVLEEYKTIFKDRLKTFSTETGLRVAQARNFLLNKSVGEYIAVLDDDDMWLDSAKLSNQLNILNNDKEIIILGTWAKMFQNGKVLGYLTPEYEHEKIRKTILFKCPFIHSSLVYSLSRALEAGGYLEDVPVAEDYGLWLRMLSRGGKGVNLNKVMVGYEINLNSLSQTSKIKSAWLGLKYAFAYRKSFYGFGIALVYWIARIFRRIIFR